MRRRVVCVLSLDAFGVWRGVGAVDMRTVVHIWERGVRYGEGPELAVSCRVFTFNVQNMLRIQDPFLSTHSSIVPASCLQPQSKLWCARFDSFQIPLRLRDFAPRKHDYHLDIKERRDVGLAGIG